MKVLLVAPETKTRVKMPPLGLLYIAGYLRSKGVNVKVLDLNVNKGFENELRVYKPSVVGISCNNSNVKQALRLGGIAKEQGILTVAGGPEPSLTPGLFTSFDGIITGEAEKTFYDYVKKPRKGIIKSSLINDLDSLPFPAIDLVNLKAYKSLFNKNKPVSSIMTSRGCPFKCAHCSHGVNGTNWRPRSPENILNEIEWQLSLGVKEICFADDNLIHDNERINGLCDLIISKGLKFDWQCPNGILIDKVSKELLAKMKAAGCWSITLSPDSGNQSVLKRLRKNFSLSKVKKVVDWCGELGIFTPVYFIIGFPFETIGGIKRTFKFINQLKPDVVLLDKFKPLPGNKLSDRSISSRLKNLSLSMYSRVYLRNNKVINLSSFRK